MDGITGLIFADEYNFDIPGVSVKRALAAVPFGARYRVIDFTLSNMMNAGIKNMGIITTQNYYSLMNHVGAGAPWDFNLKRTKLMFLPPFSTENVQSVYNNRLEAMQANIRFLKQQSTDKYVLITGNNYVGNIDFLAMLAAHEAAGARITALYSTNMRNCRKKDEFTLYQIGENGDLQDVKICEEVLDGTVQAPDIYLMERLDLLQMLEQTIRERKNSFRSAVLKEAIDSGDKVLAYKTDEPLFMIDDNVSYLQSSLDLLKEENRKALFHRENAPVITRVKDSAPTRYGNDAVVTNSLVADGVTIEGEVHNSIIFRGAVIKKGAIVENSVVMQNVSVGEMARLNYCILDKGSIINDGRMLSGYVTHPFYVEDKGVI